MAPRITMLTRRYAAGGSRTVTTLRTSSHVPGTPVNAGQSTLLVGEARSGKTDMAVRAAAEAAVEERPVIYLSSTDTALGLSKKISSAIQNESDGQTAGAAVMVGQYWNLLDIRLSLVEALVKMNVAGGRQSPALIVIEDIGVSLLRQGSFTKSNETSGLCSMMDEINSGSGWPNLARRFEGSLTREELDSISQVWTTPVATLITVQVSDSTSPADLSPYWSWSDKVVRTDGHVVKGSVA